MISTNILKIFESTMEDPSYSVVISKFNQTEFCNKDRLEMTVTQYNPNLEKIIENKMNVIEDLKALLTENNIEIPDFYEEFNINSCINRTLIIDSALDTNPNDSLFISRLSASITNDVENNTPSKKVKLTTKKGVLEIEEKDNPNLFNKTKFRIKGDDLIISLSKKINTISIKDEQVKKSNDETINEITYSMEDAEDYKITIPFLEEIDISETEEPQNVKIYHNISISYTLKNELGSQKIESITTPFAKNIELEFNNKYDTLPAVIITANEDTKKFSSYVTHFTQDINNKYDGVNIEFKNVKRSKEYDDINITIISSD